MLKLQHHPQNRNGRHHWITAGLVLAVLLLTLTQAHGQAAKGTLGAGAMFEGRPEMAGAQGGLGAQAGPPTGGLGVAPMATSNSPTCGQSNSPMAGRLDYDDSVVMAMRAAASLRR